MKLREITSKEEMLKNYDLLLEVYPTLTMNEYSTELDLMLPHNYGQVGVFDGEICAGLSGYWIGTKLWCGKYLELDNVVVSKNYRRLGIGNQLFDFFKQKAEEEKCTMLALDSYRKNLPSHDFFEANGYEARGFHFINVLDESKIR
ncbi:MAG: GNAT superfamily N-acetyltransferase [Salibacteraceae bacterium]|jgi:GNAT superfamily N-acetyltransferase